MTRFVAAGFAGDYEDIPAAFGLALGYGANERVSLEAEFGLEPCGRQGEFLQADTSVWTLSGNVLYHFAQPQFTPYLALGLGVMRSDPDIGEELFQAEDDSTTTFAYNWGGGLKSALNEHVGLRGDIRHINGSDLAPDHWRIYGGLMFRNICRERLRFRGGCFGPDALQRPSPASQAKRRTRRAKRRAHVQERHFCTCAVSAAGSAVSVRAVPAIEGCRQATVGPRTRFVARKQIAQRHEGRVQVASDGPGHGMVFTVTLPCATTH